MNKSIFKILLMLFFISNLMAIDYWDFISRTDLFEKNNDSDLVPKKEIRDKMEFNIKDGSYSLTDNSYRLTLDKHKKNQGQNFRITQWHMPSSSWHSGISDTRDKISVGMTWLFDTEEKLLATTKCSANKRWLSTTPRGCSTATSKRCEMVQTLKYRIDDIELFRKKCFDILEELVNFLNDETDKKLVKADYDHLHTWQNLPGEYLKIEDKDNDKQKSFFEEMDLNIKLLKETIYLCDKYAKYFKQPSTLSPALEKEPGTVISN